MDEQKKDQCGGSKKRFVNLWVVLLGVSLELYRLVKIIKCCGNGCVA